MASESEGRSDAREAGHLNHFRLLSEKGLSWSGREPNVLFQSRGDGTYDEVGNVIGLASRLDSRGAATGDLDGDGDLDLVVYNRNNPNLRVYRNDAPNQGAVLRVDLVGRGAGGPEAIGAQAVARCDDRAMLRQVAVGSGFLSQSERLLHFGLGGCARVDSVTVRWPGGAEETWRDLPVDARVRLVAGVPEAAATPLGARNANIDDLPAAAPAGDVSARMPAATLPMLDGSDALDPSRAQGIVVLNFWATWCIPCIAEMPDLEALHQSFGPRGVRLVGASLDERDDEESVRAFLADRNVTYEQAWGDLDLESELATLASAPPGAIPLTVVVADGLVRHVTSGPIDPAGLSARLEALLAEGAGGG